MVEEGKAARFTTESLAEMVGQVKSIGSRSMSMSNFQLCREVADGCTWLLEQL